MNKSVIDKCKTVVSHHFGWSMRPRSCGYSKGFFCFFWFLLSLSLQLRLKFKHKLPLIFTKIHLSVIHSKFE